MINIYTNKPNCPYCLKAKQYLKDKGIEFNYNVVLKEVIKNLFPTAETVPQIMDQETLIGGYDDLVSYFTELEAGVATMTKELPKKRTMFNANNTGHETGEYPLFFGEQLGFVDTINTPYPVLDELYQTQMSQIWNEFEIDLTQDRQDMLNVARPKTDLMVVNLIWQTLVDSMASRAITGLLMEFVSNSDLEALYNAIALFETIHARTYSHIIKQTFIDPNQALRDGYENEAVIKRAKSITNAFDRVADLRHDTPEADKKEAVYLAIVALFCLESINFMNSFAVTFGIAETGVFQGISQDVTLICRDELVHAKAGKELIKIDIAEINKIRPKVQALFDDIMREEKEWNSYLFSEGRQCVGINENLSNEYVDFVARPVAELLNLREVQAPENNPYPFMEGYIDSSKTQVAAQELQLTSYLLNSIQIASEETIDNTLTRLRKELEA